MKEIWKKVALQSVFQAMPCDATILAVGEQRDGGRNAYMNLVVLAWYASECQAAFCGVDPTFYVASVSVRAGMNPQLVHRSLQSLQLSDCQNFGGVTAELYDFLLGAGAPAASPTEPWELDDSFVEDNAYMKQVFSGVKWESKPQFRSRRSGTKRTADADVDVRKSRRPVECVLSPSFHSQF